MDAPAPLDDVTRAALARIADVLIPPGDGMPAASEVDATGRWLDRVLAADPSLAAPLAELAACSDLADAEALHARDAGTFERAAFGLLSAYYMHPGVRKRMGYPGQGPVPILADEPEWYLRDGIVEPVRARGIAYVPTPHA